MDIKKLNEELDKLLENEEVYTVFFEDDPDEPIEYEGNIYFDKDGIIKVAGGYWEDSRDMDVNNSILKMKNPNTFVAALNFLKKFGIGVKKFK